MDKKQGITGLRIINLVMLVDPLILLGIAFYMKNHLGYEPSPEFYEVNETIRIVQYFLYLSGLGVFFFVDAIVYSSLPSYLLFVLVIELECIYINY